MRPGFAGDGTIVSILKKIASGGSSGGGPATIADGADVAQGTTTDAASSSTVIGLLKNIKAALAGTLSTSANISNFPASQATTTVDGGSVTIGTTTDASTASTLVGLLKNLKAALAGNLSVVFPAAQHVIVDPVTFASAQHVIVDSEVPPTLTKGTQGATGFSVQELRDAGRNTRIFMLDTWTAAPVADALQSVVQWYGNVAVGATTQPAVVPAGKTLRLTGWMIMYQSLATVGAVVVRIRFNAAGLVVIASPLVAEFGAGSNAGSTTVAMTGALSVMTGSFEEGLELPAAGGIGFSMAGYGPTGTLTAEGTTRFMVYGYEY